MCDSHYYSVKGDFNHSIDFLLFVADIDLGGILDLIKLNAKYNFKLIKSEFKVMPLDFTAAWSPELQNEIKEAEIFIAADGM
jgi:hypothetical protein